MKGEILTHSPEETLQFARRFASRLKEGDVIGLIGDLGAGKTCFAKGVVAELSFVSPDEITSPTFTIVEEYPGDPNLYHVDLYRLDEPLELEELPWDDMISRKAITIIEWPEKFERIVSHCNYLIEFIKKSKKVRKIEIISKDFS